MGYEASKFKRYFYSIKRLIFKFSNTEYIDIDPISVVTFASKKSEKLLLSIYKLSLYIDNITLSKLFKYKKDIKIYLELVSHSTEKNSEYIDTNKYKIFIQDEFIPIFTTKNLTENSGYIYDKDISYEDKQKEENFLELYLFKQEDLLSSRYIHNVVLKNTTVIGAIGWLINNAKINNLYISNIENLTTYKQIIIPQLNLKGALYYLQDMYNIYKQGLILNLDLQNLYILNKNYNKIIPVGNEYNTIYVYAIKYSDADIGSGYYIDKDNKTYCIDTAFNNLNFKNNTDIINYNNGNNFKILDENKLLKAIQYDSKKNIYNFSNVYNNITNEDNFNIKYIQDIHNKDLSEIINVYKQYTDICILNISHIDVSCLSFNKSYNIIIEDKNIEKLYNKKYRPIHIDYILGKTKNNILEPRCYILLTSYS